MSSYLSKEKLNRTKYIVILIWKKLRPSRNIGLIMGYSNNEMNYQYRGCDFANREYYADRWETGIFLPENEVQMAGLAVW